MDLSLDDIIVRVDNRGGGRSRNRRSGGIGPTRYRDGRVRSRPVPYSRARGDDIAHQRDHGGSIDGTKFFLSNLDRDLCGDDIKDIYGSRFGQVREATVHYDSSGESLGTGTVTFERRADAIEAKRQHDYVRPEDRLATMAYVLSAPPADTGSRGTGQNRRSFASRSGGRGLRGGGRRGRGGPTATRRSQTARELDDELDAYFRERFRAA